MFRTILNWLSGIHTQHTATRRRGFRPHLEALEERWCLDGTWKWTGAPMVDSNWSNAGGVVWQKWDPILQVYAATAANQYPGMAGSTGDIVLFNDALAGNAILDVAAGPLRALQIIGYVDRLTLNHSLEVTGSSGNFLMTSDARISIA